MARAVFRGLCPNCGGPISSERLALGLPCSSCLPQTPRLPSNLPRSLLVKEVGGRLAETGNLKAYWRLLDMEEGLADFESFFEKATGFRLWSAQRTWARRLLLGESFAIIAPTGVGKSTLLTVYALYKASRGSRVYFLTPTESLAKQTVARIRELVEKLGLELKLACFYSSLKPVEKASQLASIESGDFDVLVTTSSFLSRRFRLVESFRFDLVEVDDVDSLLKSSKNIERVLQLLGFSEEIIDKAQKLVITKINYMKSRLAGDEERASKLLEDMRSLSAEIQGFLNTTEVGQLVVASATGRAGGLKAKIFRELLGFEAGGIHEYMRKVDVAAAELKGPEDVVRIVRDMGPGGLVFVARDLGKDMAKKVVELLKGSGVRAQLALSGRKFLEKFARGDLDVLVGIATYYGVIVRGIDMPDRVRYTVFLGVPKFTINLETAVSSPLRLLQILFYLSSRGDEEASKYFARLAKIVERLSYGELMVLRIALNSGEELEGFLGDVAKLVKEAGKYAYGRMVDILEGEDEVDLGSAILRMKGGKPVLEIPDAFTFIQASGRASRLYKGKMTYGLAVILYENKVLLDLLAKKLSFYIDGFKVEGYEDLDLFEVKKRIEESRSGDEEEQVKVRSALLVVESPTKARTIAGFFGRPSRRRMGQITVYEVPFTNPETGETILLSIVASRGHVFDLVSTEGIHGVLLEEGAYVPVYAAIKRCMKCGHQFTEAETLCPRCGSPLIKDQNATINALRRLAMEVDEVLIGTDPDTEGEKIAWDIYLALKPYNPRIGRVEFHEVTRRAVTEAIYSPRGFDEKLVEAQIVRRITDRWIGFELSRLLWRTYNKHWLGAGRVQTPVLGWIIERYKEWKEKKGYIVRLKLDTGYRLRLFYRDRLEAEETLNAVLERGVEIRSVEIEARRTPPLPPFTTDALLYEASARYGYSAVKTMRIAQDLFESGLITYHRTDSTYISPTGREIAKRYIHEVLGKPELHMARSWGTQGTHEAIRPTRPLDAENVKRLVLEGSLRVPIKLTNAHYRIYDLIFRRFIASQMAEATIKYAKLELGAGSSTVEVEVPVEVVKHGYTVVMPPQLQPWVLEKSVGDKLVVVEHNLARGSQIRLYMHGDIVRLMKERKLGRPSTYAKILSSIRKHGYIIESKKRKYLVPTSLGIEVYSFLSTSTPELVSEETTRRLEEQMDMVSSGNADYQELLRELMNTIEGLLAPITEKIAVPEADAGEEDAEQRSD